MTTGGTTMTWTQAQEAALALAKGTYQRNIVLGRQNIAGSDLHGKARVWSARYRASRSHLQANLVWAGIPHCIGKGPYGHLYLIWGTEEVQRYEQNEERLRQIYRDNPGETRAARAARSEAYQMFLHATGW